MSTSVDFKDWPRLIRSIKEGRCTPFLGAGMSYPYLPLGGEIAQRWADEHNYPMTDSYDLIKVSQYLAVEQFPMYPKDEIVALFAEKNPKINFKDGSQPHGILSALPISTYITTNYDDFMAQALTARFRDPKVEICRWNSQVKDRPSLFDQGYKPTPANPVVFHLHGHMRDSYSCVLTEDDYLDFLVNVAHDASIIPHPIQQAITQTSLLFIGYRLADWNFRVLLQTLTRFMEQGQKRRHLAVMLPPQGIEGQEERVLDYWVKYYERLDIQVCWTSAVDFLTELGRKWEAAQ